MPERDHDAEMRNVPALGAAHDVMSGLAGSETALTAKPSEYYVSDRSPFLEWLHVGARRVLDIGCGAGRSGQWLRARGASTIVGIEVDPKSAAVAAAVYDEVYAEPVESALDRIHGEFDLILCADVLEHLVDPWSVVQRLRERSTPTTRLAVSIPNIRYIGALWRIAFGSGFEYEREGTFDQTHLRFFTRSNVTAMLEGGGWEIERRGRSLRSLRARVASKLSGGRADEWLAYQWYALARPKP